MDAGVKYAHDIAEGRIPAGKYIKAAYVRFLDELDRSKADPKFPYVYDEAQALRALSFFPKCLILPGSSDAHGQTFKLFPWQKGLLSQVYGWQYRDGGGRRYSTVYCEGAKAIGKSPFAAGVALYHVFFLNRLAATGYMFAFSREQASFAFGPASVMARQINKGQPKNRRFAIHGSAPYEYNISYRPKNQYLRRIASQKDAKGKAGASVWFACGDEIVEHNDGTMIQSMIDGMKFGRGPLCILLTNAGKSRHGIGWEWHNYAVRSLDPKFKIEDDNFLGLVYSVDGEDDPHTDESCWVKANPSLAHGQPSMEYYRRAVKGAKGMPSRMAEVDRLYFSRWTEGSVPFIDAPTFYKCTTCESEGGAPESEFPSVEERKKLPCWLAGDLSLVSDMTSFAAIWWDKDKNRYYAKSYCWLPEEDLELRSNRDDTDYATLVREGHLALCDGATIDYDILAGWIGVMMGKYKPRMMAYDPHKFKLLQRACKLMGVRVYNHNEFGSGLPCVPHGQQRFMYRDKSGLSMPNSIDELERLIRAWGSDRPHILIQHNPCLAAAFLGVEVKLDANAGRTFDKAEARYRIDPLTALTMAAGLAVNFKSQRTAQEEMGSWMESVSGD